MKKQRSVASGDASIPDGWKSYNGSTTKGFRHEICDVGPVDLQVPEATRINGTGLI